MASHDKNVAPDLAAIPPLMEWIEQRCQEAGLASELTFKLMLAIEEAATNVVSYAFAEVPPPHRFRVRLDIDDKRCAAELADNGRPFDPSAAPPPDLTAALDQQETGDVVGLLVAGGKFGGGSDDFLDEVSGADAPLAIEDCFEPRFAKNVSGRVERLGDAVGEHEQRVAGSEHGFGDGVRAVGVDAKRDAGRFQQVAAAARAQQIRRVVAGIAVAQPAGFEIEDTGEHRHKHAG